MRLPLLTLVLLASACSREPAPRQAASSALPPSPDASIAQSVPAGGAPAPSTSVSPAGAASTADVPAAALAAPRQDPRWRDVDPAELAAGAAPAVGKDPALESFQEEQRRRDAELMAQDAGEAERHAARGGDDFRRDGGRVGQDRYDDSERVAGETRDWRDSERYRRYAERRERYRGEQGRYPDPRRDDRHADDERYSGEAEYPPEEMDPYAQPEPWDEIPEGPEPDEDYDPRYEDPYRR
jgi:hypothetical protein